MIQFLKKWGPRVLLSVALLTLLLGGIGASPVQASALKTDAGISIVCNKYDVSHDGSKICDGPGFGDWILLEKGATMENGDIAVSYSYMYGMSTVHVSGFIRKIVYCRWWDGLLNKPCPYWYIFVQ